jgi:hypothetical protein
VNSGRTPRLAHALRALRESTWPERVLTHAQLAKALSCEGRIAAATLSSWESTTNPKTPSAAKISAYARFFCTARSVEGEPHLISEDELTESELKRFRELESRLLELIHPQDRQARRTFQFAAGPVIVICPTAPSDVQCPLPTRQDPNFTKLRQYGDLDALIELYGHLRAENPTLDVFHRLTSDVVSDDFTSHVILLGGIGWNKVTRRFSVPLARCRSARRLWTTWKLGRFPGLDERRHAVLLPGIRGPWGGHGTHCGHRLHCTPSQSIQDQPHTHDLQWNS